MKSWQKYLIVGIVSAILTFGLTVNYYENLYNLTDNNLKHKIDSLSLKVDSLKKVKDSVSIVIEERWDTINNIKIIYEKNRINILSMSADEQCEFFSEYLSKNSKRLFNNNNSDAITTN